MAILKHKALAYRGKVFIGIKVLSLGGVILLVHPANRRSEREGLKFCDRFQTLIKTTSFWNYCLSTRHNPCDVGISNLFCRSFFKSHANIAFSGVDNFIQEAPLS